MILVVCIHFSSWELGSGILCTRIVSNWASEMQVPVFELRMDKEARSERLVIIIRPLTYN